MSALYHLDRVHFGYSMQPVLEIEQLEIADNSVTALLGSNGAGKSTLLKLLAFLENPQQGNIRFKGDNPTDSSLLSYRRRIGLVAQKPYLLQGTVFENVSLGLKFRGVSAEQVKKQVFAALDTVGMAYFAQRSATGLSGGEAQKVALARALALQPEVLLLDEPFSHLDQASIEDLSQVITTFATQEGRSVIFTTHDRLHAIALADEVIGLVSGHPVLVPLLNLFHGRVVNNCFETGSLSIYLPEDIQSGRHIAVDPREIVLSCQPLTSSMRNCIEGRVVMIAEEKGRVRVTVEAGERFHAQITHQSLDELGLALGGQVWLNFKSTAVKVF